MLNTVRAIVLIAVFSVVSLEFVQAQDEHPDMPMRGPGMERIERLKKVRLMEVLKLQEEASVRFFNRYNEYQDALKKFQKTRQETLVKVETLQNSGASDTELEKGIQALRSLDSTFLEMRDNHWKDIRGILNMKQFAAYVVFEHNFQHYLREMMRGLQRNRPGGRMMQHDR